jgi:hypothetical protein
MTDSETSDSVRYRPLALGDELVAHVGHSSLGGPPLFMVERCDGSRTYLGGHISPRAQRRIQKALRRAWGEVVRDVG